MLPRVNMRMPLRRDAFSPGCIALFFGFAM
jgi:hypothetical protein